MDLISVYSDVEDVAEDTSVDVHAFKQKIQAMQQQSFNKFEAKWSAILDKYLQVDDEKESDEIDLSTGKIYKDNGHLRLMNAAQTVWIDYDEIDSIDRREKYVKKKRRSQLKRDGLFHRPQPLNFNIQNQNSSNYTSNVKYDNNDIKYDNNYTNFDINYDDTNETNVTIESDTSRDIHGVSTGRPLLSSWVDLDIRHISPTKRTRSNLYVQTDQNSMFVKPKPDLALHPLECDDNILLVSPSPKKRKSKGGLPGAHPPEPPEPLEPLELRRTSNRRSQPARLDGSPRRSASDEVSDAFTEDEDSPVKPHRHKYIDAYISEVLGNPTPKLGFSKITSSGFSRESTLALHSPSPDMDQSNTSDTTYSLIETEEETLVPDTRIYDPEMHRHVPRVSRSRSRSRFDTDSDTDNAHEDGSDSDTEPYSAAESVSVSESVSESAAESVSVSVSESDIHQSTSAEASFDFSDEYSIISTSSVTERTIHTCPFSCVFATGNKSLFIKHLMESHSPELAAAGYPIDKNTLKSRPDSVYVSPQTKLLLYQSFPLIWDIPALPQTDNLKPVYCNLLVNGRKCQKWFLSLQERRSHTNMAPNDCSSKRQVQLCPVLGCGYMTDEGYLQWRDHFVKARHHVMKDEQEKDVDDEEDTTSVGSNGEVSEETHTIQKIHKPDFVFDSIMKADEEGYSSIDELFDD